MKFPGALAGELRPLRLPACILLLLSLFVGAAAPATQAQTPAAGSTVASLQTAELFQALVDPESARSYSGERISELAASRDRSDAEWPLATFLLAEVSALRGDRDTARALHRELALWAAEDPYGDGWGGSGLAIVSLWRWQKELAGQDEPEPGKVMEAIEAGDALLDDRLTEGMFRTAIFDALPQLGDAVRRLRPGLAWTAGNQRHALRLFVDYLRTAGAADLTEAEEALLKEASEADLASRDWLLLLRAQRLLDLNRHADARPLLERAFTSDNLDVRAEAGLALSEALRATERRSLEMQEEVVTKVVAGAADPYLVQRAILARGYLYKRAGRDPQMLRDFERLVEEYPAGPFTDDALVEIARYHQNRGDLDRAIEVFERLQAFPGDNDWSDTAVYQPAIALFTRNGPGDLERAFAMLQEYEKYAVPGPVRRVALFWLGRVAEEIGRTDDAEGYFRLTIAEMPYDYYAVRARMHLNVGAGARQMVTVDAKTHDDLAREFEASFVDDEPKGNSPYLQRFLAARRSGLYEQVLASRDRLREAFPGQRAEEVDLHELDEAAVLAPLAILMALRQDAIAAKDARPGARRRLRIAGALLQMGDVPFASHIATGVGEKYEWRGEAQQNSRFLATAYPPVFRETFREAAAAHRLDPAFLYAVARQESSFDPYAVSALGAIGLFQFMKPAFEEMNPNDVLLRRSGTANLREFLTDAERSIQLGAEWFAERKLPPFDGNIALAVMAHHAGTTAVTRWKRDWDAIGKGDDIEFMVETARSRGTRYLARRVLADYAIVRAAGIFDRN